MNKRFSNASLLSVFLIAMLFCGIVFPRDILAATDTPTILKDGDDVATNAGLNNVEKTTADEMMELELNGCDPDVYNDLLARYNNKLQKEKNKIESMIEDPKPLSGLSCLEADLDDLWNGMQTSFSKIKNFKIDVKSLGNIAKDKIKEFADNQVMGIVQMVCDQSDILKNFIKNQQQCFDFSKVFRWKKLGTIPLDGCLIEFNGSLSKNGFKYSLDSSFGLIKNREGTFGASDLALLGNGGVNTLFDDNSFERNDLSGYQHSSASCKTLDSLFADYKDPDAEGYEPNRLTLFNPAEQIHYDNETGDLYWQVSTDCSGDDSCETRTSCYELPMSINAPAGTCFRVDPDTGDRDKNDSGVPKLFASISNRVLCNGVTLPDMAEGEAAAGGDYANVTCLGYRKFEETCGTGAGTTCCDPAYYDCNNSTVPICYCHYASESSGNPPLDILADWQTQEMDSARRDAFTEWFTERNLIPADPANPNDDIMVAGSCNRDKDLIVACCDPEINDCDGNPMLSTMPLCADEDNICLNFNAANFFDASGDENRGVEINIIDDLGVEDIFSYYDYLVIKPDVVVEAYAKNNQQPITGRQPSVACCSTEWCNICPDMIMGAAVLRDKVGLTPSDIGIVNNNFFRGGVDARGIGHYAQASASSGKQEFINNATVGVDWDNVGLGSGIFAGYQTGNVFAFRNYSRSGYVDAGPYAGGNVTQSSDLIALASNVVQPPSEHCIGIVPTPAEVIDCAEYERATGLYASGKFGQFMCGVPGVGMLVNLVSSIGNLFGGDGNDSGCTPPADRCEAVDPLPLEFYPFDSTLIQDGLPIANVNIDEDSGEEYPKLCQEYDQCQSEELESLYSAFDQLGEIDQGGFMGRFRTIDAFPIEQRNTICLLSCDMNGANDRICRSCYSWYTSCGRNEYQTAPVDTIPAGDQSCLDRDIQWYFSQGEHVTAEFCSEVCSTDSGLAACSGCLAAYGYSCSGAVSCAEDLERLNVRIYSGEFADEGEISVNMNGGLITESPSAQPSPTSNKGVPSQWQQTPSAVPAPSSATKPSDNGDGKKSIGDVLKGLF